MKNYYYVNVIEEPPGRVILAGGPYATHQEARTMVSRVRVLVLERDSSGSWEDFAVEDYSVQRAGGRKVLAGVVGGAILGSALTILLWLATK